jgi:hypothetical protein
LTHCFTQYVHKRLAIASELFFKPARAIALPAGPGLGAVFVPAIIATMGIDHADQLEILFPVRPFFL